MASGCPLTAVRRIRSFCIGRATEGRSFYVQIKDQFRPTWRSYAGPPQQRRISVPVDGDSLGSKYRYSRKQGGSEGAGCRRAFGPGRSVRPGNGFAFRAGSEGSYKAHSMEAGGAPAAPFYNAPEGRHHPLNLLNLLNLLNPLNPHARRACPLPPPQPSGPKGPSNLRTLRTFARKAGVPLPL